jgi:uncharacterized membrane protein
MIYTGRPGLWHDWQRFQAKARVARKEAEEAARRKRKQIIEITIVTFFLVLGLTIMAAFVLLLMHSQGKL